MHSLCLPIILRDNDLSKIREEIALHVLMFTQYISYFYIIIFYKQYFYKKIEF